MYFVESLARDDKVKTNLEPFQWSRIKALLSRLYDASNPAQSLGLYVERIMYWRNPPETFGWFTVSLIAAFYCLKHRLAFMLKPVTSKESTFDTVACLMVPIALLYTVGISAVAPRIHFHVCPQDPQQPLWISRGL